MGSFAAETSFPRSLGLPGDRRLATDCSPPVSRRCRTRRGLGTRGFASYHGGVNVRPLLLTALIAVAPASSPDLSRLAGDWVLQFRAFPATPATQAKRGVATLTLADSVDHGRHAMMGPYSLSMGGLTRPDPCISTGGTARLVPMRRDSVRVDLRQGFNCGLWIVGVVRGDSVLGKWRQKSPAGIVAQGRFVMTRARR